MDDRRKGFGGLPRGGTCRDRAGAGLHLATIHPNEFSDGRVEDAGNWAPNREGEVISDVATYLKIAGGFEVLVPGKPLRQNNREASLLWEALQRDTAELIELHWPDIERVTEALLLRGELGEKETPAATTSVSSGSTVQRQKS
jgi:hypothetical protein